MGMVISAKERSVVFEGFPLDKALYQKDVQKIQAEAIRRYGFNEWRAAVLTCELHGHLGIYSLLGVKMGILALEQFPGSESELQITSHAGSKPPLSCLNDGLQVATGATLGHGTIRLSESSAPVAEAHFERDKRTVCIALKSEIAERIAGDIAHGRKRSGGVTPAYWEYVRHLALEYWVELDRQAIFDLTIR